MSNLAIKRIGVDMKNFQKGELDKVGIYCKFNEQDIFKAKILIVGPKDTPYEGGYYFFDLNSFSMSSLIIKTTLRNPVRIAS